MQQLLPEPKKFRLNLRAAIVLGLVVVLTAIGVFTLRYRQVSKLRASAMASAIRLIEEGRVDLALRNLNLILQTAPDDAPALELKASLMATSAKSVDELLNAASANDQFLRAYPDAPGAQQARRRTSDLYIRFSDLYQDSSYYYSSPETKGYNVRYRAAASMAESLISRGADDADAHRLLAQAREGLTRGGDTTMLNPAISEYEIAIKRDPTQVTTAERLSNLLNDQLHDPARSILVMDELARRLPNSADVRLARHRFFAKLGRDDQASKELKAALDLVPDDPSACLAASETALQRGRTNEAREFVSKIKPELRASLRVRLVLGLIEFNENHPEEAMETWRQGLISSLGSDAMMTWNLAFSLMQLGRVAEGQQLVAQYRRLVNDDSSPMLNLLLAIEDQKTGHSLKAAFRLDRLRDRIDHRWSQLLDYSLGQCYAEIGDLDRSTIAYRRVVQANPRGIAARVALADNLVKTSPDEAAAIAVSGLTTAPDNPLLWVTLAWARCSQQAKLPAIARSWEAYDQAMARATQLAPGHPALTMARSLRQSVDGKTNDVVSIMEEALGRQPRNAQLWRTYVETLLKADRLVEALEVLDRASEPGAIGDQAGLRLIRARTLSSLGRAKEGREQLVRDLQKLVPDQRAEIWDALGRDLANRGNSSEARAIYIEWAKSFPEDTRPRLGLLEQVLHDGVADSQAASKAIHDLRIPDDLASRLNQLLELIRKAPVGGSQTSRQEEIRLRETEKALEGLGTEAPQLASVDTVQGELFLRQGRIADASSAYRRAWRKGSESILPRLVALLAQNRPSELEEFSNLNSSNRLVRLAVQALIEVGQTDRAARIAARDDGPSGSPEMVAWRVDQLSRMGETTSVETLLRAETIRRPESMEPWLPLLRFQVKQGQSEAIARTITEAKKAIKDTRSDFVEARLRWAGGDGPGADRAFQASLVKNPDDVEILLAASDFDQETGRLARSESHLKQLMTRDRQQRPASRKLALQLVSRPFDEAGWERAWAILGPESTGSTESEDRLVRAILLSKSPGTDRRRRATEILEALVADLPYEIKAASTARVLLARLWLDAGQADRVSRLLDSSVQQEENVEELALHAEALIQTGQFDPAARQLDRLASLVPGDDREARLRARLIRARSRPEEIAPALERFFLTLEDSPRARAFGREAFAIFATATPPANESANKVGRRLASWTPGASWMPAMIASRNGGAAEALQLCRAAVETADPADARESSRVAFGAAFADAGIDHRKELEAILETASRRDPSGTEISLQLAQLRHQQGRFEEVLRLYREILGRRPDLRPSILNNMAWVLSENLQKPAEAIPLVDELLKTQGRTAAVLDTRGVILTRLKRLDEATRDLEESIRITPDPVHLFHLARAYRDAGQTENFRRCRNLVRQAGLTPNLVDPSERADLSSLMQP